MAVTDIKSLTFGDNTFNLKDPTKYVKPSGGIPQTDLEQTVQNKLDKTVVVSDTQPTETENKLWVDIDAGSGESYQVPTVAEMQAADNSILGNLAMIESSPATQAHAVGDYIVYNGQLYKVTAAISQGQTLNPATGGNIEAVTVGNQMTDLKAHINDRIYLHYFSTQTHEKIRIRNTGSSSVSIFIASKNAIIFVNAHTNGTLEYTTTNTSVVPTKSSNTEYTVNIGSWSSGMIAVIGNQTYEMTYEN